MFAYLHIPFCGSRCIYCDFYSGTEKRLIPDYIAALKAEIRYRHREVSSIEPLQSIYFGGGTPSQLSPKQIAELIDLLASLYGVAPNAEITLEANPEDMLPDYVRQIAKLPINRISMGVQSWQDRDLLFLRRRHNAERAERAVRLCQDEGLSNISLDLIYGLPEQTLALWQSNLLKTISLRPTHISAYHLVYEEQTALTKLLQAGSVEEVSEELSLTLFSLLIEQLAAAGYEQYEISNFATVGHRAVHNSAYWKGEAYLGFGPAAHSYDGQHIRRANEANLKTYIQALRKGMDAPHINEHLDQRDLVNEAIMCALRTMEGIDMQSFALRFGQKALQSIMQAASSYLTKGDLFKTDTHLRLSRKGIFISDRIMSDLFV
ncbi:MAG: radical SAM family heme chaperone HemW [Porphyromonas sp.]|nr:radical SAM family heme chaperone HemW [Porphyromonas sp.]